MVQLLKEKVYIVRVHCTTKILSPAFLSAASDFQLLCPKRLEACWYSWCQYLVYIDTSWCKIPRLILTSTRLHQTTDLHHRHLTEKESHKAVMPKPK